MNAHEKPRKHGTYPLSADVERHIKEVRKKHPDIVKVRRVMDSVEGRPIRAVIVTDPNVPDSHKQHALIVGGQHGNEESGRAVALAVIDWLTTKAAASIRRKQKVVVMPNVSPDACERDQYVNVDGVNPNRDHAIDGPTSPEGMALEKVAYELMPEVFVDLHACGGAGCSVDLALFPPTRPYTEDDYFLHRMVDDMARAGEKAGIPQSTFPISWWGLKELDEPSSTVFLYRNFKTLEVLTENTESNTHTYTLRDRARAGLAKVKAFLAWGNRRHPKLYYEGYPNMLAGGTFDRGLMAVGKTASVRRKSRVAIWKELDHFKKVNYDIPQEAKHKKVLLEYAGVRLKTGVGVQTAARGRLKVGRVTLDGRTLKPSETNGFYTWTDVCTTFVVVAIPDLKPGEYLIEINYTDGPPA